VGAVEIIIDDDDERVKMQTLIADETLTLTLTLFYPLYNTQIRILPSYNNDGRPCCSTAVGNKYTMTLTRKLK